MEVFSLGVSDIETEEWHTELTKFPQVGEILAVFYSYDTAPYEGNGEALIVTAVGWFRYNLAPGASSSGTNFSSSSV